MKKNSIKILNEKNGKYKIILPELPTASYLARHGELTGLA
jgi:hypothetical protein